MIVVLACCFAAFAIGQPTHWVVSWGAAASPPPDSGQIAKAGLEFDNQTLREIVHLSLGGSAVRVRFSNFFAKQSLEIGAAHLALRATESAIQASSDRALTFGGAPSVTIPPNAFVLSDPVSLAVPPLRDLVVSIFLPHVSDAAGIHYLAQQNSYIGAGDLTAALSIANAKPLKYWVFLAGVDVSAPSPAEAIALFGDSRVDGDGSTPNANKRLPDALAARLAERGMPIGVVNAGIIGNRLLHDAPQTAVMLGENGLSRFDRDVLDQPGVKYVIVLDGIVDIGLPGTPFATKAEAVSVDDLIAAMKQLIARAHDRGMKIFGATQTPFAGATSIPNIFGDEKNAQRKAFNQWIRTSHAFDGVMDFDKVVADPANPERIRPEWDAGDHIHCNDAGNEALAKSIDLSWFK